MDHSKIVFSKRRIGPQGCIPDWVDVWYDQAGHRLQFSLENVWVNVPKLPSTRRMYAIISLKPSQVNEIAMIQERLQELAQHHQTKLFEASVFEEDHKFFQPFLKRRNENTKAEGFGVMARPAEVRPDSICTNVPTLKDGSIDKRLCEVIDLDGLPCEWGGQEELKSIKVEMRKAYVLKKYLLPVLNVVKIVVNRRDKDDEEDIMR